MFGVQVGTACLVFFIAALESHGQLWSNCTQPDSWCGQDRAKSGRSSDVFSGTGELLGPRKSSCDHCLWVPLEVLGHCFRYLWGAGTLLILDRSGELWAGPGAKEPHGQGPARFQSARPACQMQQIGPKRDCQHHFKVYLRLMIP